MSLSSLIRAVAGGPKKTRAEGDKPEEEMEDDVEVDETGDEAAEGDKPEEDAEDEDQPADAEGDAPEEEETAPAGKAEKAAFASGRRAERNRIARIMGHASADANPGLAAHLAFATSRPASEAIATLKAGGIAPGRGLASRMAGSGQPRLGGSHGGGSRGATTQPERIQAAAAAMIEAKRNKKR